MNPLELDSRFMKKKKNGSVLLLKFVKLRLLLRLLALLFTIKRIDVPLALVLLKPACAIVAISLIIF